MGASTWIGLSLMLGVAFMLELTLGSVRIPLGSVLRILMGAPVERETWRTILFFYRLPRGVTAGLAGAALAISGLQMQTLFRNPLAGPSILGIGSGAGLGVALVVLASSTTDAAVFVGELGMQGEMAVVVAAAAGSALVLLLVLAVSRRVKSVITLLILGLLFGYAANGVVSILMHFSIAERIQSYISWTFGNFGGTTWRQLRIYVPVVLVTVLLAQFARKSLNGLLLGESYARSMGVNIRRARALLLVTTAVLTGTVTAFCGPIAFLGVAVPHLCRSLFNTSDHRVLLPSCAFLGATVALVSDLVAQLPGSHLVLPLNAVTALVGAPVIAWVILRRRNVRETFAS